MRLQVREGSPFLFRPIPSDRRDMEQIIRVRYRLADGVLQAFNLSDAIRTVATDGKALSFMMPLVPGATAATNITI